MVTIENPSGVNSGNKPLSYSLKQNYPNPFNPSTQIRFTIPESEMVNLSVYNMLGEKVTELVNETLSSGEYNIRFDAKGFSSGVYIAKIQAGSFIHLIKMTLLK